MFKTAILYCLLLEQHMSLRPRNIHFPCVFIVCCVFLFLFLGSNGDSPIERYTTLDRPITSSQAREGEEHESMNQS